MKDTNLFPGIVNNMAPDDPTTQGASTAMVLP